MRLWLTSFIFLFGATELFQWGQQVSLPTPLFVLGGVVLAIASNYDKFSNLPWHLDKPSETMPPEAATKAVAPAASQPIAPTSVRQPTSRGVSFEIQKPFKPGD